MKISPKSVENARTKHFSSENHVLVEIDDFLEEPQDAIESASLQNFAKITPQYPGIRAPLESDTAKAWLDQLSPMLDEVFGTAKNGWAIQAWYSIVTTPPGELVPMQCFPHVDGTDPSQLAMMLYLNETDHGGTGFFRHRSTGFTALTDANFPHYRDALQADVQRTGLPPRRYVTDGAPHFERVHATSGAFNHAVFYRGNLLHSGIIENASDLPTDPRTGRLTINAFFRPL